MAKKKITKKVIKKLVKSIVKKKDVSQPGKAANRR